MVSLKAWPFKKKKTASSLRSATFDSSSQSPSPGAQQAALAAADRSHVDHGDINNAASPQGLPLALSKLNFQDEANAALNSQNGHASSPHKTSHDNSIASSADKTSRYIPLYPGRDPYNESIASRNITSSEPHDTDLHSPTTSTALHSGKSSLRRVPSRTTLPASPTSPRKVSDVPSLNHKPSHADLRSSLDSTRSHDPLKPDSIPSANLDKPLPAKPALPTIPSAATIIANAHAPPADTTDIHTTTAPAVTHEVITRTTHEIHTPLITREIHAHDVHHRILPVVDTQFLPPRHFVPAPGAPADGSGALVELPAADLPQHLRESAERAVEKMQQQWDANALNQGHSQTFSTDEHRESGAAMTAGASVSNANAQPVQAAHREGVSAEGTYLAETMWVHPPTMQT